jgi:hypothetical protein
MIPAMSRRLRIDPLLIAGLVALSIPGAAQVMSTTGAPPGPRVGMIVGQVVDGSTGEPVSEAIVTLGMPRYAGNLTTPTGRVMAAGEGRFFFTEQRHRARRRSPPATTPSWRSLHEGGCIRDS